MFFNPTVRYGREIIGVSDAMLEFETEIDGIFVNGVDIVHWNDEGQIADFKVVLGTLKAINLIHTQTGAIPSVGQVSVVRSGHAIGRTSLSLPRTLQADAHVDVGRSEMPLTRQWTLTKGTQ